jgi:type II secretory pathway pseudopilin PulG
MTMIEILVALAIVGLMLLILPTAFKRVRKTDMRSDAGRIAAALRSAYDRASATAAHHRLVLDLDSGKYWIERCEGKVHMVRDIDEAKAEAQQAILAQLAKPPDTPASIPGMSAPPAGDLLGSLTPPPNVDNTVGSGEATLPCTPAKGQGTGELTHASKIIFKAVHVGHLETAADKGKVAVNFFPMGRAERAVVVLGDDGDAAYSVRLHALSGRVEIKEGEYKRPEEIVEGEDGAK